MGRASDAVRSSFWRSPTHDAEFLAGRFGDFVYDPHTHDRACLALITRGAIHIRMRDTDFVARAGDLYAIDAEVVHAGEAAAAGGWSQRTIYLDPARLAEQLAEGGRRRGEGHIRGPVIRDARLLSLFLALHRGTEAEADALGLDECWLAFGERLVADHTTTEIAVTEPGREPRAVGLARAFLDADLARSVRLGEIATAAGLPPFRLLRAFTRHTGLTPHAYQRQARVRAAVELLRRGEAPAEVAAAVGFADQAHLTRCFRRRMGITPGAFRSALRAAPATT